MIKKLLKYTFIVFVAVCAIQLWLNTKDYIFSDKAVSDVSAKYVGKPSGIHLLGSGVTISKSQSQSVPKFFFSHFYEV